MRKQNLLLFLALFLFLPSFPAQLVSIPPVATDTTLLLTAAPVASQTSSTGIVLCMDVSGSMSGTGIEDSKSAAHLIVDMISDDTYIGLVTYDSYAYQIVDIDKKSNNEYLLNNAIDAMAANSSTNIDAGILAAIDMLDGVYLNDEYIVLMTDGYTNTADIGRENFAYGDDYYSPGDGYSYLYHWIHDSDSAPNICESNGICLHTVGFGGGYDETFLESIANAAGCGNFYDASNASALAMSFAQISNEMEGWSNQQTFYGSIDDGDQIQVDSQYTVSSSTPFVRVSISWEDSDMDLSIITKAEDGGELTPIDSESGDKYTWAVYDCYGLGWVSLWLSANAQDSYSYSTDYGLNVAQNDEYENFNPGDNAYQPTTNQRMFPFFLIPGYELIFLVLGTALAIGFIILENRRRNAIKH
ncbi:MAG: vWA domain-containing protein [Promethearchaeota archaeon]